MVWARLQTPWSEITSPTASGSRRGDSRPYLIRAMTEPLIPKDRIPWRHLALFGWLPSPLKILAYRLLLGYRIGRGVRFSFGGIVVGQIVEIGDHVEIGFLAVVQGRRIKIGRYSSVGVMSYVSCETIEIGEDARIREQVYVGGPQLPESRFVLGRDRKSARLNSSHGSISCAVFCLKNKTARRQRTSLRL